MQNKIPEFITMSNGIGKQWHEQYGKDTHKDYITVNYAKHKVPRYYDTLLDKKDPELLKQIKEKRIEVAKATEKEPQKLKQEATIKKRQIKQLKREL